MTRDAPTALLLDLLGLPRSPDADRHAGAATADWDRVLMLAGENLLPMLAFRVGERGVDVPVAVGSRLQAARRAGGVMLAQRRSALRRAFAALEQAGVPFVVLKGLALAHQVYPSPELRVMSDVDLWVRSDSLRPAMAALEPLGWRLPWWRRTQAHWTEDGESTGLRLGDSALLVEVHRFPRSLADRIPDELDAILARCESADVAGHTVQVLAVEDQLVHLSLHLADHHRFVAALPRLLDVTLVLAAAGSRIDWPAFVDRCRRLGIAGWVATTLGTARHLLGAPVPPDALAAFGVAELDRLCALAGDQVWLSEKSAVGPQSLLAASGPADRLRRLAARARDLLLGEGSGIGGMRPDLLARRLRYAAQFTLPALIRTVSRGTFRGEAGARHRRLSAENRDLAEAMRQRSRPADG